MGNPLQRYSANLLYKIYDESHTGDHLRMVNVNDHTKAMRIVARAVATDEANIADAPLAAAVVSVDLT